MCGICGILDYDVEIISEELLYYMINKIKHRGPDDSDSYISKNIGLGHVRLSIIDLTPTGKQPMISDDGKLVLIYNGEIYNYKLLRSELEKKGIIFNGNSDTEVVLKSFQVFGIDAFKKFNGMFSLAIWNNETKNLLLARDRFGIKPLYYYKRKNFIIFASEIKSILEYEKIERTMNYSSLHEYLYYGASLGSKTMFNGIEKLLPGHILIFKKEECSIEKYIDFLDKFQNDDSLITATYNVREKIENSVKNHLISDVPVGIFLSGGIDSTTITALASRYCSNKLKTFTAGFDFDKKNCELSLARKIANEYNTEHHELNIYSKNITEIIENLVKCHDEPFGDAADIPIYLLCKELKGEVKVVLQGDGGDEIFAGYRRYNILNFEKIWRALSFLGVKIKHFSPDNPTMYRLNRFFQAMNNPDPAVRNALLLTEESIDYPPTRILSKDILCQVKLNDPFKLYKEAYKKFKNYDSVQNMLMTDCSILLPDIYLEKVDKASMAHGVEVRVPFLDSNLTDYVFSLPSSMKIKNGQKKWLLRESMREIVPNYVLNGKKRGLSVPYSSWLKGPLAYYMKDILLDKKNLSSGIFDEISLNNCINQHISGKKNNGLLLYRLINLSLWNNFYMK